jgi:pilus assembly protein Flp/PilA
MFCLPRLSHAVSHGLRQFFIGATSMLAFFSSVLRDENGATAIEYGLIAALISVVIISVVTAVGTSLAETFSSVASAL